MAGLAPKERYSTTGVDGEPHYCPGCPVNPTRQVYGDQWDAGPVHRLDHGPRQTPDLAVQASAKQRVDHDIRVRQRGWRGLLDGTVPALSGERRITFQLLAVADEIHPHRMTPPGKMTSRYEAVAAIIAGTGHNHYPTTALQENDGGIGDSTASILHHSHAGRNPGDRKPVCLGQRRGREKFDHGH